MTCVHCEELREEVAYLKGELGLVHSSGRLQALRRDYGLTPREALLLETLYSARGRTLNHFQILEAIGSDNSESSNLATVFVSLIRKKLGKNVIRTDWGAGFSIGSRGVEIVETAMARIAA